MSIFITVLFAVSIQTPSQPPSPGQSATGAHPTPAAAVSVIGCLQSSNVDGRDQFTLTARDTNRAEADVKTLTYQLNPTSSVDLKSHVGQRVQVTGTESRVAAETRDSQTSTSTQKASGTSGKTARVETNAQSDIVLRQFNVTDVKTVASNCRVP